MTDKERLENMSTIGFDLDGNILLKGVDYHWLMEQAERVELLERENKALNDMLTTLEKQDITKLLNQNVRLIKQNKRYREALEFYADENNYVVTWDDDYEQVLQDGGEIARQALEGE